MRSRTEENSRDNVASLMSPTALRQCSQTWACSSLILLLLLYWSFASASLYLTQSTAMLLSSFQPILRAGIHSSTEENIRRDRHFIFFLSCRMGWRGGWISWSRTSKRLQRLWSKRERRTYLYCTWSSRQISQKGFGSVRRVLYDIMLPRQIDPCGRLKREFVVIPIIFKIGSERYMDPTEYIYIHEISYPTWQLVNFHFCVRSACRIQLLFHCQRYLASIALFFYISWWYGMENEFHSTLFDLDNDHNWK